jgi:hypothetical protein
MVRREAARIGLTNETANVVVLDPPHPTWVVVARMFVAIDARHDLE